jgi:hypothetical protein
MRDSGAMHIYVCMYMYMHIYMCMYMYMHIHVYMYTFECAVESECVRASDTCLYDQH